MNNKLMLSILTGQLKTKYDSQLAKPIFEIKQRKYQKQFVPLLPELTRNYNIEVYSSKANSVGNYKN